MSPCAPADVGTTETAAPPRRAPRGGTAPTARAVVEVVTDSHQDAEAISDPIEVVAESSAAGGPA